MKKVLLTTFTLIFALATYAQCPVEPFINTNYLKDAKILALREIQSNPEDPDYDNPILPASRYQPYLEGLSTIYANPNNLAVVDSMFVLFGIHANPKYANPITPYNTIGFQVPSTTSWIQDFKETGISGDVALDNLMSTYNFTVESWNDFNSCSCTWFIVTTNDFINPKALEDDFENISAIDEAEAYIDDPTFNYTGITYIVNGQWGSDFAAVANISVNNNIYSFTLYAGDCFAGCMYSESWDFQINEDCTFTPMATQNFEFNNVQLYPNPAGDVISLKNGENIQSIRIYNPNGALVKETTETENISVSNLSHGVYFVKLIADNGASITRKFVRM